MKTTDTFYTRKCRKLNKSIKKQNDIGIIDINLSSCRIRTSREHLFDLNNSIVLSSHLGFTSAAFPNRCAGKCHDKGRIYIP